GCDAPPAPLAVTHDPGSPLHAALRGSPFSVSGRVVWDGPSPSVPAVNALRAKSGGGIVALTRPHPNLPRIDAETRGLAGVVVTLRGIDPSNAKPWDHPPVTIELHDERPLVRQGGAAFDNVGFVRRGDAITMVSRQNHFHVLRARG